MTEREFRRRVVVLVGAIVAAASWLSILALAWAWIIHPEIQTLPGVTAGIVFAMMAVISTGVIGVVDE